jgi:hypothetical protein
MEVHMEKRARQMVDILRNAGLNCGLLSMQRTVVMRCPGAPYSDSPTMYDEPDLNNAIALNLLEKRKMTGSYEWEYYVVRTPHIGEFVATSRGLIEIVYHAEGIVHLKGDPNHPILVSDLQPSLGGRPNVWVIVPKE